MLAHDRLEAEGQECSDTMIVCIYCISHDYEITALSPLSCLAVANSFRFSRLELISYHLAITVLQTRNNADVVMISFNLSFLPEFYAGPIPAARFIILLVYVSFSSHCLISFFRS